MSGGTRLLHWVGASGLFEMMIAPLRPAVLLFDTVYNDALHNAPSAEFEALLDRVQWLTWPGRAECAPE